MSSAHIETLKEDLRQEFYLDLDKYVAEESPGQFVAKYLGLKLESTFQPVVDPVRNCINGFEALLRPAIGSVTPISPLLAFHYADAGGKLVKFDRICRSLHLLNSLALPADSGPLFVNVHPKLLLSVNAHGRVFEHILHLHAVPTHRVVIEIRESVVDDEARLLEAAENYRDRGYKIAIDGFGLGRSSLERLWHLEPDFVKFDVDWIRKATAAPKLRRIFPRLVELVQEAGAVAVIQGIETRQQADFALACGARDLQGHFPGAPAPASHWRDLQYEIHPTRQADL